MLKAQFPEGVAMEKWLDNKDAEFTERFTANCEKQTVYVTLTGVPFPWRPLSASQVALGEQQRSTTMVSSCLTTGTEPWQWIEMSESVGQSKSSLLHVFSPRYFIQGWKLARCMQGIRQGRNIRSGKSVWCWSDEWNEENLLQRSQVPRRL